MAIAGVDIVLAPNSPPQRAFIETESFECLYGGAAGGGKSAGLVLASLDQVGHPDYSGILFRRTFPQLRGPGGLLSIAREFIGAIPGADWREVDHAWTLPNGATIRFAHLANVNDHYDHQGKEYHFVGFDELSHFTQEQYTYLFSRIRRRVDSGIRTRMAAATNPGAQWIFRRWRPWLDPEHQNPAGPGELRWFRLDGETEVECRKTDAGAWSRTFIPASYRDNPAIDQDQYERNLDLLPFVERRRLKYSDWRVTAGRGTILNQAWFKQADRIPDGCMIYRFWDFAATEKRLKGNDPDYTATCMLATDGEDFYLRLDRKQCSWQTTKRWLDACMRHESWCVHGGEQEGGAAGKILAAEIADVAARIGVGWHAVKPQGDKVARALRWSALAEQGRVYLLTGGEAIENILHEYHAFPDGDHDDMVDATSGAFALASLGTEHAVGEY